MSVFSAVFQFCVQNTYCLLAASAALYGALLHSNYRRLKAFRGPWAAKFTDLWLAKAALGDSQHAVLADVCEKYGSIACIGPNTLVTNSPELWMRMSAARSPYTKGDWYAGLRLPPGRDNIFSQQDEEIHTKRRAQMADGYAGKTNPTLEPTISRHVQNLIDLLRRKYISSDKVFKPVDMGRKASFFTMDVITDVAFGQPFQNLTDDHDTFSYIQNTEDMIPTILRMATIPALRALFQSKFGALLFPSDKSEKGVGKLMGVAKQLASKRFAAKDTDVRQDMLSSFISRGLTEDDVMIESVLQILAGADTTATAIRSILLHTMTNPHVYRTLQKEIDTAVEEGRATRSGVIKDFDAKELPYLQAVIKEGLRIWPPVTGMLSKLSPPEGDNFTLASGEEVHIPGRLETGGTKDEVKRFAMMEKLSELIFGYGKYQCLGKNVASLELNKAIFELFRCFDFQIVSPTKPWRSTNVGLWLQSEMWVRVTERVANN
ncbi:pisatin demethylase [Mollisia scopiformis]|uniref:Pisatin demethylase n=1 Tax=Mollisia scopiformis TaxID=149040 RepID=A0A194XQI4_MOLSC|nr:pisatin demethylase [Mollisia scopiformis]KUJ22530.1 pisatin demethylase [Mollisia scopiformis]